MIVEPTNENPRAFRSLEMASESSVRGGICFWDCPVVDQRLSAGPLPEVRVEAAELLLDLQEPLRVVDG